MIYHITYRKAWSEALQRGEYRAESLETEGFIHCSTRAQILPVVEKFYKGQGTLLLLLIDPSRLASELRWEPPSGASPPPGVPQGEMFPHVHGPINPDAVVKVFDLEANTDGRYDLPVFD